jgi:hypothetical protein
MADEANCTLKTIYRKYFLMKKIILISNINVQGYESRQGLDKIRFKTSEKNKPNKCILDA